MFEWNDTAISGHRGVRSASYSGPLDIALAKFRIDLVNPTDDEQLLGFRVVQTFGSSTDVSIDIKPGSDPNSINLGSKGNIPVVIFSTDTFDATEVNPATILLAGAGVMERGKEGELMASFEDIDLDGMLDLLIHIDTQGLVLGDGDVEALLTGETFDGDSISGTDTINLVGQSGGQHPATFTGEDAPLLALSAVPEPGSITLLLCGLGSLLCWRRRK